MGGQNLRIAWFSRFDAPQSPSSYFSETILPYFLERSGGPFAISLYGEGTGRFRNLPVKHYLAAAIDHQENPFDLFFYQLEQGREAGFMRMHLGLLPGVVLFHDFVMPDFGPEPIMNSPWERVVQLFNNLETVWPVSTQEQPQYAPYAIREATLSVVPVFTSEQFHSDFKRLVTRKIGAALGIERSYFLPYPVVDVAEARCIAEDPQTIAISGNPGVESRSYHVLEALERLLIQNSVEFKATWAVDSDRDRKTLVRALQEFPVLTSSRAFQLEILRGRTPVMWSEVVSRSSLAIHLHFSAYGQVGPYLNISQMSGVPCVVSDFGAMDYQSENLVFKVRPGTDEGDAIAAAMRRGLQAGPTHRRNIRSYARECFDGRKVSQELAAIFTSNRADLSRFSAAWAQFEKQAESHLQ